MLVKKKGCALIRVWTLFWQHTVIFIWTSRQLVHYLFTVVPVVELASNRLVRCEHRQHRFHYVMNNLQHTDNMFISHLKPALYDKTISNLYQKLFHGKLYPIQGLA